MCDWAELTLICCDLHPRSAEFVGERIPTLKEAVNLCMELDLLIFVEIKSTTITDEVQYYAFDLIGIRK